VISYESRLNCIADTLRAPPDRSIRGVFCNLTARATPIKTHTATLAAIRIQGDGTQQSVQEVLRQRSPHFRSAAIPAFELAARRTYPTNHRSSIAAMITTFSERGLKKIVEIVREIGRWVLSPAELRSSAGSHGGQVPASGNHRIAIYTERSGRVCRLSDVESCSTGPPTFFLSGLSAEVD
jgi:hypothetical protein